MRKLFKNNAGQMRLGWDLFLALLLFVGLQFAIVLVLSIKWGGNSLVSSVRPELITPLGGIAATLLIWVLLKKRTLRDLGMRCSFTGVRELGAGIVLGFGFMSMIAAILVAAGAVTLRINPSWSASGLLWSLMMFIGVAFSEEMFFRGYIMKTMEALKYRLPFAYTVSAILFALIHLGNNDVSALALLNIFLIGLLFAYMFTVTGSLWMPIGYHLAWNFTQGSVYGLAVSGNEVNGIFEAAFQPQLSWLTGGDFGPEAELLDTAMSMLGFMVLYVWHRRRRGKT
ncbi:CPBP family intramembrane glutamic endopeptidase [Paenibacillus ehimensis]|uniref:Type II CAAX endopeptidase family protein n=1 Tax=Paenibacillus ehimensis TaxID=79264 RepID=A0ABT8VFE5_9BACL|nr:type II CAAX endopeptidase family protein [Paenibacillus ehimensis]MDO3679701.1 type II CAAX endopeptidase family protein [Paenibacillus ehimensis]MEC0211514.1 type II CAAX endopeptidase family protein [Paenibacillus ehimensis]